MNKQLQDKKGFLDFLYYKVNNQRDFFVAGTYEKDDKIGFSKWKTYMSAVAIIDVLNDDNDWKDEKYFEAINQRQILPHEIVLDIEDPKQLNPVLDKLKEYAWDYSVWKTGSRGFHVHLLGKRDMTTIEKEAIVSKLGTDIQKCSEKCLIALENEKHWKSGNPKIEVKNE